MNSQNQTQNPEQLAPPPENPVVVQADQLRAEIAQDSADVAEMAADGSLTDEEVAVFGREIDEKQLMLKFFDDTLRGLSMSNADKNPNRSESKQKEATTIIKLSKIGWLDGQDELTLPLEKLEDKDIYLGSLVEQNNATRRAKERLEAQNEWDKLLDRLEAGLPQLWQNILTGSGGLRPVSIGGRKSGKNQHVLNTTYPAYKVGVEGTNNRAIIMVGDKLNGKPVFILAALYDHEDQVSILKSLNV